MRCVACGEPGASAHSCPSCGAGRKPASAADLEAAFSEAPPPLGRPRVGQDFGPRYHILKMLGAGGMGLVYLAHDTELNVRVALKVLRPATSAGGLRMAAELQGRFTSELLLARQITHKNVIRIHDIGEVNGIRFISMPFIDGEDLATPLAEGPLPLARTLRYARHLASGLMAVHAAGVVHRDIKPANVMIGEGDQAVLMDFGIARSSAAGAAQLTAPGGSPGTLAYMSPEQATGGQTDQRTDIYAFGLLLQEMITGTRELSVLEIVARMKAAPPSLRQSHPEVPEAVDAIVTRCLQPNPSKRYQTAIELAQAISALPRDGRQRAAAGGMARRWMPRIAVTALLALLAGFGYWAFTHGVITRLARSLAPDTAAAEETAEATPESGGANSAPREAEPTPVAATGTSFETPDDTRREPSGLQGGLPDMRGGPSRSATDPATDAISRGEFWKAALKAEEAVKADANAQSRDEYVSLATSAVLMSPESARTQYERMAATGPAGASLAAAGLADLALYEGQYSTAANILEAAIARDARTADREGLATKYLELAEARAGQGRRPSAVTAIGRALETSRDESVLLPAAHLYITLDRNDEARALAKELDRANDDTSRAYGRVVTAELALDRGDTAGAIETLRMVLRTTDLWIVRFVLGSAYLQAKQYPEAIAELNMCEVRQGEAAALFQDDEPSIRYLATLQYLMARAREGAGFTNDTTRNVRHFVALPKSSANGNAERDARSRPTQAVN